MNPRRWWILGVLCLTLLVLSVDSMILNLAIPSLMRDLNADPADVQWVLDAYILVFAGGLITAGSLSDRYGRRRLLVVGLAVLGGASLLAAFASLPWQVVACRAVMGLGGALAMPSTLSILITVFEEEERRKAMAAWSAVGMLGVVAGPTLGGLLLQHYWWGAAFLVNVPLSIAAIVAALVLIPESHAKPRPADPIGVVLSSGGMAALVWVIISLPHEGWSASLIVWLVVAAVTLTLFAVWESRTPHPMLPLSMFRNRDFTGASLSVVLLMFATGALELGLTQYLQFVLSYGPMKAGLALVPMAVAAAGFNVVGATLGKRLSNKTLLVAGLVVIGAAFGILATVGPGDGYPPVALALVVIGIGSGLGGPAAYTMLMGAIPREHAGVGSAVNDTIQQAGLAIGVAVLGSVLSAAYSGALPATVPEAARTSIAHTLELAATRGSAELADEAREAFVSAMSVVSIAGLLLSIAGSIFALVVVRGRTPAADRPKVDIIG